jgi:predicted peptidase
MRRAATFAIVLALTGPALAAAEKDATGFLERSVRVGDARRGYKVWLPPGFDRGRSWPVVLFLHGAGEAGTDGVQQTEVGLGPLLHTHPERFPAVVVFPQATRSEVWLGPAARMATGALDQTIAEFGGDPDRIYLAGLSMGAYGCWVLAFEHPERYAAIVSVAGGIVPPPARLARLSELPPTLKADDPYAATAARVKGIPAWLFHGSADPTVPVTESRRIVAALQQAGSSPRYDEYEGVAHNSWERAFADPELPKWLLAQRRGGRLTH